MRKEEYVIYFRWLWGLTVSWLTLLLSSRLAFRKDLAFSKRLRGHINLLDKTEPFYILQHLREKARMPRSEERGSMANGGLWALAHN